MPESTFFLNNFAIKPGHCVQVDGYIPKGSKSFHINFGKDEKNLALNFNPRFDYDGDKNKIVLNSKVDGVYGDSPKKESFFPFNAETDTSICFKFIPHEVTIHILQGKPIQFPFSTPIQEISYVSAGGLQIKSVTQN